MYELTINPLEDVDRAATKLKDNVEAVERLAGHKLSRQPHRVVEGEA